MKRSTHIHLLTFTFACALFFAVSLNAQNTPSAPAQQPTPGAAYQDGFDHGKADAQNSLPSYGQPGDQWTSQEARSAYAQGYGAGYAQGTSDSGYFGPEPSAIASPQASGGDAGRIGYEDGHAAGSRDLDAGNAFRPGDSEMYKKADHGWTPKLGDKDRYREAYRQAFARGYQEGYGNSPTTY